jgi:hypothetical protein
MCIPLLANLSEINFYIGPAFLHFFKHQHSYDSTGSFDISFIGKAAGDVGERLVDGLTLHALNHRHVVHSGSGEVEGIALGAEEATSRADVDADQGQRLQRHGRRSIHPGLALHLK